MDKCNCCNGVLQNLYIKNQKTGHSLLPESKYYHKVIGFGYCKRCKKPSIRVI